MEVEKEIARLGAEAQRCRDLARQMVTQSTRDLLQTTAREFDDTADKLDAEMKSAGSG
jgi:hypothetical protein